MPALTANYNPGDPYTNVAANAVAAFINSLTGVVLPFAGSVAPTGWLLCYGQAVSRTTYATLFNVLNLTLGNPTVTIANPAVVTLANHGLNTGDPVIFTTTGALPTGITAGTTYYVTNPATNTFNIATTFARAQAGTPKVTTTGSQSGVHTLTYSPYGYGDGTNTFNVPDYRGRQPAGQDNMGGTAAGRLTGIAGSVAGSTLGASGGEESHNLSTTEMPAHSHAFDNAGAALSYGGSGSTATVPAGANVATTSISSTGGGANHNNVQPTIMANYIICT